MTGASLEPELLEVQDRGGQQGYRYLVLETRRGAVEARLYEPSGATAAVIMVGGVGGGFDSPARGLYVRLADDLLSSGIATLRVRFRNPTQLHEATHDVLAGTRMLAERHVQHVGLVGHSFGGAVVIEAGAAADEVKTVVALSSQSYGTDRAPDLSPRPLLLVHGTADRVLPPSCSVYIYELARMPKELRLLDGVGHGLDEAVEDVRSLVLEWLVTSLSPPSA